METERYPISVSLVGVLHKDDSKMYMASVLWSDQNEIVVYRSFSDFQNMHKQLKKAFPSASKLNKSNRILPKFEGIKMKGTGRAKGPKKSLVHLKYLQKYCNGLMSCDPKVSQSAELIRFFQAKEKELQPEFTKNCIMIVPFEDEVRSNGGHRNSGNVTQPFLTETYRCVAPYETKDIKNKPFKVAAEEKLDVLIKDKAGWWLVESEDKRMAWFPAPFLEKLEEEKDEDEMDGIPERGSLYTVIKSYKSTKVDEISVSMGVVVEVLLKSEDGWWLARYNGKIGYIPTMHLQPYRYPHIHLTPQHQDSNSSSSLLAPTSNLPHSRSHGNLTQLPPLLASSPTPIQQSIQRSRSMNQLSEDPDPRPAGSHAVSESNTPTKPAVAVRVLPPIITVQADDEKEVQSPTADTYDSFESDSFSDHTGSVSGGSSFNLSYSYNDDRLRLSRTPVPTTDNHLSPTGHPQGKLLPSISDPNLYKRSTSPKVPPRPRAQEILTRCSTITRSNAAKSSLSPTDLEVISR